MAGGHKGSFREDGQSYDILFKTLLSFFPQILPGDNIDVVLTPIHDIPIDEGTRFTIREGKRTGM
jgi:translation elongation factor EF-Tu-like GTPase